MSESATKDVVIGHNLGLHLRAAGALVQTASRFDCEIAIQNGNIIANGKSIMSVLSLAAPCGTKLEVRASGPNAEHAVNAIIQLVEAGFNL